MALDGKVEINFLLLLKSTFGFGKPGKPQEEDKKCAPSITITQNEVVVSQLCKSGEERETVR